MENITSTPAATTRPIYEIAREIRKDWGSKLNYAARPYVDAMDSLDGIHGAYYADSAKEIIIRFLCNANAWRGDTARRVKAELKKMAGIK